MATLETKVEGVEKTLEDVDKKVDKVSEKLDGLLEKYEKRFAAKWVEIAVGVVIGLMCTAVIGALMAVVIIQPQLKTEMSAGKAK